MLEFEKEFVQEIDNLILNTLKENAEIRKERINVVNNTETEKIIEKINEKMNIVFLLFQDNFSINERNLEEKIEVKKANLNFCDRVANTIVLKRLYSIIDDIESLAAKNGRIISVCLDRKLFIEKVLKSNISLALVEKFIHKEHIEK